LPPDRRQATQAVVSWFRGFRLQEATCAITVQTEAPAA
jgi:hypothetical protein